MWFFFYSNYTLWKIKKTLFLRGHSSELSQPCEKNQVVYLSFSLWLMNLVPSKSIVTHSGLAVPCRGQGDTWEWTPACSRLQANLPGTATTPKEGALVWFARKRPVCWPGSRADTSHRDPGAKGPASEQPWSQQGQAVRAAHVLHCCQICAPCPQAQGQIMAGTKQALRTGVGQCTLCMGACDFILFL